MKKDIKLVLSGSGTVFYIHFGGIKCLLNYFNIKEVIGTSGGSIIAALISCGYSTNQIENILKEINLKNNADWSFNPLYRFGLVDGNKILNTLKKYLNKKFSETVIPLTITVTNVKTGKAKYYSTLETPNALIYDVIRASLSVPLLFKYHILENNVCVDGGLVDNFPIDFFKTDLKVIGLRVLSKNSEIKGFDDIPFQPFSLDYWKKACFSIVEYLFLLLNIIMASSEQKHIDNAIYSNIINLKTNYNNLSFEHTSIDINNMILEGFKQCEENLKSKGEI